MGNKVGAILLDTRSIQRYVFGCNDLKTNTGASYLVDAIFEEAMLEVLKSSGFKNLICDWENRQELLMKIDATVDCEVAYIGGGNMIILVRDTDDFAICKRIVSEWSTKLLVAAPGLKTGAAIGALDLDEGFQASLNLLYGQLKEHQNTIFPNVDLPYTGLTLECDASGKAAEVEHTYYNDDNKPETRLIATEVEAKLIAQKHAVAKNKLIYKDILKDEFEFCKDISKIGYKLGESYICVIHIDGNNMGVKFSGCSSLEERKALSSEIAKVVKESFGDLAAKIIEEYDEYNNFLDVVKLSEGDKKNLPIRPIIIGGDDITFVCPGRVGLEYTRYFMEKISSRKIMSDELHKKLEGKLGKTVSRNMTCCAGVAIVPAKYPFFRAYELAEQLCSAAKLKSREMDGFYLDFAILHGEMYADLETLRKDQYISFCGKLHFGPYDVINEEAEDSFSKLVELKNALQMLPGNKVKALREVLHEDLHSQEIWLEHCEGFKSVLKLMGKPDIASATDLWQDVDNEKITRLMDAIEIMDYTY